MKKYLSIFCYIVIFLMVLTGCSTKINKKELKIIKDDSSDTSAFGISGERVDYIIENFKSGKYEISFYSKEYEKGEFIKEHKIYNSTLDTDDEGLSVGIYQESKIVRFFIDPNSVASISKDVTLDFFNDSTKEIELSALEKEKVLTLDEEIPIALFSSNNDGSISSVDIDEGYKLGSNEKDLVVFMKCELIN